MPNELAVHWEAAPPPPSPQAAVATWEIIRRMHINLGYSDIAYNWGTDDFGQIHQGRGWDRDTAANGKGHNAGNRAVCWLGGPGFSPSPQAYEATTQVVRDGFTRGFTVVKAHSDYVPTQCPGDDWRAWIDGQGWNNGTGGDFTLTQNQMDELAQWEQDTRTVILDQLVGLHGPDVKNVLGQWESQTRAQINAHTDARIAEVLAAIEKQSGGEDFTEDQIRAFVREEVRSQLDAKFG